MQAAIFVATETKPLLTLGKLEEMAGVYNETTPVGDLTSDKRFHFVPEAKLLVTIPPTNDRLVLRRVDLLRSLAESDVDYLFVTSVPPVATRGHLLTYQLSAKSKRGGIKYELSDGPAGMAMSPSGKLTWMIPASWVEDDVAVVITVSDVTGQETLHKFHVDVTASR